MSNLGDNDKYYLPMYISSLFFLLMSLYWYSYPIFYDAGLTVPGIDEIFTRLANAGFYRSPYIFKGLVAVIVVLTVIVRSGKPTKASWPAILIVLFTGLILFFMPLRSKWYLAYFILAILGYILMLAGFGLLGRKLHNAETPDNDLEDTFEQCNYKIDTPDSINIPIIYKYKKKLRKGWINVVQPYRAGAILGLPGSGKSFAIYYSMIEQMIDKGYTMFVYDYKFPDLCEIVYNKWRLKYKDVPESERPQFCVLNFNDPRYSMRCNPLDPMYLTDQADAHEVADLIMKNVQGDGAKDGDFFVESAKVYIAGNVWFLRKYKGGIYCDFPHLIELLGQDYKEVLQILDRDDELKVMLQPFSDALASGAQEQLQGQIASARIPLLKFPSPALYWALTGNDFTLDLNNPDRPKIIVMGNNPDRQTIYGTALALYTSRMFKVINHKTNADGKRNIKCGILLDELPTIYIKGLDQLIATARSNKVAIMLGAQDKSQLVRDYKQDYAEVIFNTVGNIFAGQVNGRTAKDLSEMFGKEFRAQESQTTGGSSDTINRSYHQQDILPPYAIENLSQGYFFGRVADDTDHPIKRKLYCGRVDIDIKRRKREEASWEKMPKFGASSFRDDAVAEECKQDERGTVIKYLTDLVIEQDAKKLVNDPKANVYTEDTRYLAEQAVAEEYDRMDEKQRETYLAEAIKRRQEEEMNAVLAKNYHDIKEDITMLMNESRKTGADSGPQKQQNAPTSAPAQGAAQTPAASTGGGNQPDSGENDGGEDEDGNSEPSIESLEFAGGNVDDYRDDDMSDYLPS